MDGEPHAGVSRAGTVAENASTSEVVVGTSEGLAEVIDRVGSPNDVVVGDASRGHDGLLGGVPPGGIGPRLRAAVAGLGPWDEISPDCAARADAVLSALHVRPVRSLDGDVRRWTGWRRGWAAGSHRRIRLRRWAGWARPG